MKRPSYANEELDICKKQLEVCKTVIREISWLAQRYVDGRHTYTPSQFNSAIKLLDDNGLGYLHEADTIGDKSRFAKEG